MECGEFHNLFLAYKKARKHKTTKDYVIEFEKNLEHNLLQFDKNFQVSILPFYFSFLWAIKKSLILFIISIHS